MLQWHAMTRQSFGGLDKTMKFCQCNLCGQEADDCSVGVMKACELSKEDSRVNVTVNMRGARQFAACLPQGMFAAAPCF